MVMCENPLGRAAGESEANAQRSGKSECAQDRLVQFPTTRPLDYELQARRKPNDVFAARVHPAVPESANIEFARQAFQV
jgi:hypothetical protein